MSTVKENATSRNPPPIEIRVKLLDPNGDMSFIPSPKHLNHGDAVRWICENKTPFTIAFPDRSPFPVQQLQGGKAAFVDGTIDPKAKGVYRYNVAILVEDLIYVDCGCPEIVVK